MRPRWKGETVTCSCGDPTQNPSGECAMCESEAVMFAPTPRKDIEKLERELADARRDIGILQRQLAAERARSQALSEKLGDAP